MSLLKYLALQPIDSSDDETVSDLDRYEHDEVIDLSNDEDGDELIQEWEAISDDIHNNSTNDTPGDSRD